RQYVNGLVEMTRPFQAAPGLELLAIELQALQELVGTELRCGFQLRSVRLRRQLVKRQDVDVERRDIEHNLFFVGGQDPVFGIAERFAQPPDAGSKIVEQGLVHGVAPKQCCKPAAGLTAFWAQGQKGKEGAFALAWDGDFLAAGKCSKFETADETERPSQRPIFYIRRCVVYCWPDIHADQPRRLCA